MIHATLDLETLDVSPTATVLSIGGVKFDPFTSDSPHSRFYYKICVDDQDKLGRTTSEDTIKWWAQQDPAIMEEAFDQTDAVTVAKVLDELNRWVVGVDVFWGQGYGFDYTILENMYRSLGRPVPWNFWQIRDSRTLFGLMREDPRKKIQKEKHDAYADAYFQSKAIQIAFADLGVPEPWT